MIRTVYAHLECEVITTADVVVSVAVAEGSTPANEIIDVTSDGAAIQLDEVRDDHGTRLHLAAGVPVGRLVIDYAAQVTSLAAASPVRPVDLVRYLRPSRYCESDRLSPVARSEFAGLTGADLLDAVSSWVGTHVQYVPGSSRPIDGAVATLLARNGVCRDFAHLAIAFLRACEIPARMVSVYAPGLHPMDFHAVAEAYVCGAWNVVDPTCLAPRSTMIRIATGRDAADTAFLSTASGHVELTAMEVGASTNDPLPVDDIDHLAQLN